MKAGQQEPTRVEMLKALVLTTETGYPAHYSVVQQQYGKHVHPAPEDGWWWIGATPKSAADIRARGLHAQGTLTTTFFPPQPALDFDVNEFHLSDVPAIASPQFREECLLRTEKRRDLVLARKEARAA